MTCGASKVSFMCSGRCMRLEETLVIISHQERILRIADEIVLLADGTVQAQGPGDEMMMRVLTAGGVKAACCREEALFRE